MLIKVSFRGLLNRADTEQAGEMTAVAEQGSPGLCGNPSAPQQHRRLLYQGEGLQHAAHPTPGFCCRLFSAEDYSL